MIYGIGIDIIEIQRIKESVDKLGDKFLNKIFTEKELDYSLSKPNKYQHLAARFAAKEAVTKALGTGWNGEFSWKNIEVSNDEKGKPLVNLTGPLVEALSDGKKLQVTMSHSREYVSCFAIIHKNE
ncbi:MAG: holo-[acyl-carrier-protein] synthase [Chlorobiaceae bacterium]|nr:holo-[acyl-carrier-protein] synthase [Chlorobiaceae bacterium]MBA4308733.1 holo-[acyl-carrier-protein] synthase [Chlorobiaceae bacterium]